MGLSRTVSEINGDFSRKSQSFPTPGVLNAPTKGVPAWNWVPVPGVKKNYNDGDTGWRKKSDDFSHLDYTNMSDRRTDTGRQQIPNLGIALRGKTKSSSFGQVLLMQ